MDRPLRVGAVMYDPKVSVIWEIIHDFFESQRSPIDVSFYSTYDLQVSALLDGTIDVAWNSPLAWLDSQRRSEIPVARLPCAIRIAIERSYLIARSDDDVQNGGGSCAAARLRRARSDSPQATLIPLGLCGRRRHPDTDLTVLRFDVLVGKHGDHVGGEHEAFPCLRRGEVAACAMLDLNWDTWTRDGTIDTRRIRASSRKPNASIIASLPSGRLSAPAAERGWLDALFAMRYDVPEHREMMDLEGLKAWLPGRTSGFAALTAAVMQNGSSKRAA